jgi:GNAT superfamily N-acetyltransferase
MSESATVPQRHGSLLVRGAEPADHEAIRGVVLGAYAQYAGQLAPETFSRYLAGQLDLGTHASYGRLLVAGTEDGVRGFAAFYPDASVLDFGFPPGWADVRVLAVHPGADGPAVARALLGACEHLAAEAGAPVLAIRTASFMTDDIAGYERLGYRRAPEFDGAEPVRSVAHLRYVAQMYLTWPARSRFLMPGAFGQAGQAQPALQVHLPHRLHPSLLALPTPETQECGTLHILVAALPQRS